MRGALSARSCSSHATFSNSLCVFLSLGYTVPPSCCCWACWLQGKGVLCFDKLLAQACSHLEGEPIEDCDHFVYAMPFGQIFAKEFFSNQFDNSELNMQRD